MLEHRFESNLCSIENGVGGSERYWFTPEEEQEIQRHNEAFYLAHPEEELFRNHFRAASSDEAYEMLFFVGDFGGVERKTWWFVAQCQYGEVWQCIGCIGSGKGTYQVG